MAMDFGVTIIAFLIVANMTFIVIVACGVFLSHATLRVISVNIKKLVDIVEKQGLANKESKE